MLRCRLSTVRTLGGHDRHSCPRLPSFFTAQTTFRFSRACVVQALDTPAVTLSSERRDSHLTYDAVCPPSRSSRNCSKDRDTCGTARARNSHSAIDSLKRYLSSENVASDDSSIYSSTAIRSLYYRAESRNQLGMLDSGMLTRLIGILGSLSIDPHVPIAYRVPLVSRLLEVPTRRTHWAFVLKVGKYKLERGLPLHDSDRFWLMRAELAIAQFNSSFEPLLADAYRAVLRARSNYHIIRRHSRHPEVHVHYLETLLATGDSRLLDLAARDLSFLLRTQRVCHPWLQRLLYLLVTKHGNSLPNGSQETILAALWSRVCQNVNGTPDLALIYSQSVIVADRYKLDVTTMARSLSVNLFRIGSRLPIDKFANPYGHLFSVLSPEHALPSRWSSLISLFTFNFSETPHLHDIYCPSDHPMSLATLCWQVIFGLATVERNLHRPSSALAIQPLDDVLATTRKLYQRWLPIARSRLVYPDLACAIVTSFLKIASMLLDATLFYNCQSLYHVGNNSERPLTLVERQFAAQYTATAVRIQGALPGVVLPVLESLSPDLEQRRQVTASAVEILAPMDATLAYMLYTVAKENGMKPNPRATHALAMSLAQSGALRQSLEFLNCSQISLEKRGIFVATIAKSLRDNPQTRHTPGVYVAIVDELAALYRSHVPPEHFRGHLEQLFVVLACHGRGSQILPVVASIIRQSPGFFQPRFFYRYCRVLAQHKQFATVRKFIDVVTVVCPKVAKSLFILAGRTEIRTKVSRMFTQVSPLRGPASLRLSSRLRRYPYSGPSLECSLQELLKSGRVLAAKRILTCAAPGLPSKRCTTLGNILLHGVSRQSTPRNGRRVRKVLTLLENLVQDHNFRPDRVTINILVRVLIDWRSAFDSSRLRELFDQLIRGGCPAAEYSALHLPFGTRQTSSLRSVGFGKLPSLVSFEKHAKPMFKMFIKAFYLRNDVEAARKVVGILKVEEHKNAVAKEARRIARFRGRVKAVQVRKNPNPDSLLPYD